MHNKQLPSSPSNNLLPVMLFFDCPVVWLEHFQHIIVLTGATPGCPGNNKCLERNLGGCSPFHVLFHSLFIFLVLIWTIDGFSFCDTKWRMMSLHDKSSKWPGWLTNIRFIAQAKGLTWFTISHAHLIWTFFVCVCVCVYGPGIWYVCMYVFG